MSARESVERGARFPYDAPDVWWEDDTAPPPEAEDWAHRAARGVLADLSDRKGIKQALDGIDQRTRAEIVGALSAIIWFAEQETTR